MPHPGAGRVALRPKCAQRSCVQYRVRLGYCFSRAVASGIARGRRRMPPRGVKSGSKRARQYEHIKESGTRRGMSSDRAEEMAARTVNKDRSEANESRGGGGGGSRKGGRKSSGGSRKSAA